MVMSVYLAYKEESACDSVFASWREARWVPTDDVHAWTCRGTRSCWGRLIKVVTQERRKWKLAGLHTVETKHAQAVARMQYPEAWPAFPLKYLV